MVYWELFLAFARANLLGYGGGPSVIPLIKAEVVETYGWFTDAEFADVLAIGNTLPGPIATKMSAFIGYKVGGGSLTGVLGALSALIGTVLPTALLMIVLAALLFRYKDATLVKGMIRGAKPVVWVLFVLLVIEFLPFVRPDKAGLIPFAIAATALVASIYFKVHQAILIGAGILVGGILLR